jgi:hypothetical protein
MPLQNFHYLISWSDFISRQSRPTGVNEDAQIHPEMSSSNVKLGRKGKAVIITDLDVNIDLVKSDCWVVENQKSDYLLKHEQGHYDILGISAREFYNSMKNLSAPSTHELQKMVTKLQEDTQKNVARVDARYDAQTKHSLDKTAQESWDKKIRAEKQKPNGSIDNLP